ncbi:transcription initiation factor IID, 18kD subunit-domain-containing protein [Leucosporidium creatinivorum]|uniref:Transcription initiation factor TFIID subunit 13 n=1 Tax=Leucosporidium creatinivorum TaxID=106004 RepID=A0A1Y2FZD8_9BASI|nr:transcription initiation factor IID, 18kD subunit-domain-containing protein [Leucosporidium creatinivorum]
MSKDVAKDAKVHKARILKKGLFAKDLSAMMYGFGDESPAADTINVMEELVIEHISDVCAQAQRVSSTRGKIKVDDFKFALRKDPKKLARVDELLFMTEVIARARGKDDLIQVAEEEAAAEEAKKKADMSIGAALAAKEKEKAEKAAAEAASKKGGAGAASASAAGSGGAEGSKKKSKKGKEKAVA